MKNKNYWKISEELYRVKRHYRIVDGLAALAETYIDGCETEWAAMYNSLLALADDLKCDIKEIEDKMKESE